MIITNENTECIFFEVVKRVEPRSILDVGMFLNRCGSVSRGMMKEELEEDVVLIGLEIFHEISFPICRKIYNEIIDIDTYDFAQLPKFELLIALGGQEQREILGNSNIASKLAAGCEHILTDDLDFWFGKRENPQYTDLHMDNDIYYLL